MITLSYQGQADLGLVEQAAEQALDNTNLTLQTGENVATGEATPQDLPAGQRDGHHRPGVGPAGQPGGQLPR